MLAASMEAPSYGASRLPFTIRHRPTVYVTKFAISTLRGNATNAQFWQRSRRNPPTPAPTMTPSIATKSVVCTTAAIIRCVDC
jgi:hypothetical protein